MSLIRGQTCAITTSPDTLRSADPMCHVRRVWLCHTRTLARSQRTASLISDLNWTMKYGIQVHMRSVLRTSEGTLEDADGVFATPDGDACPKDVSLARFYHLQSLRYWIHSR